MVYALLIIFMILYHNADMVMMEDGWLIWIEKEIMSHSLAPSEISRKVDAGIHGRSNLSELQKGIKGSTDGRFGPFFKREFRD